MSSSFRKFYLVENRFEKAFTKEKKDKRYHQLFLAKNTEEYYFPHRNREKGVNFTEKIEHGNINRIAA